MKTSMRIDISLVTFFVMIVNSPFIMTSKIAGLLFQLLQWSSFEEQFSQIEKGKKNIL